MAMPSLLQNIGGAQADPFGVEIGVVVGIYLHKLGNENDYNTRTRRAQNPMSKIYIY